MIYGTTSSMYCTLAGFLAKNVVGFFKGYYFMLYLTPSGGDFLSTNITWYELNFNFQSNINECIPRANLRGRRYVLIFDTNKTYLVEDQFLTLFDWYYSYPVAAVLLCMKGGEGCNHEEFEISTKVASSRPV